MGCKVLLHLFNILLAATLCCCAATERLHLLPTSQLIDDFTGLAEGGGGGPFVPKVLQQTTTAHMLSYHLLNRNHAALCG
jgi:hypothetical protein